MKHFYFCRVAAAFCFVLPFFLPDFSAGQDIPVTAATESLAETAAIDPLRISVNATEVRLDVVVVDGRGRPITDLTAADFEIYQDKQPQEVTSSVYINDQTAAAVSPAASRKAAPNLKPFSIPDTALKKEEDVRRTIVFVVDTLSMTGEDMNFTKMALKRFVENQMQPGDLVSIMRTDYGNGISDRFVSDKRQLTARIDGLYVQLAMPDRIYGSQLNSLSYGIRALKDMPGRKIIFFVTPEPTIDNTFDSFTRPAADGGTEITPNSERPAIKYYELYGNRFDQMADEAMRAGVVVHLLDAAGLCVPFFDPACEARLNKKKEFPLNPLPAKTGGIIVTDSNFFLDGIGDHANNMISGYYLLSYVPPANTFDSDAFHRVSIKVKRSGAVVHTREGFYSRIVNEEDSASPTMNPLANAIFSPFEHAGLDVNMAAGYIKSPTFGNTGATRAVATGSGFMRVPLDEKPKAETPDYIIRAWIHVNAKDLKIVETEDGGARIEFETVCLASDINGNVQDLKEIKYIFSIKPENRTDGIALIQSHDLRFTLLLPVKKPGAYTIHTAVRDVGSGNVGSAYQFVEIPDLKKKGLELSSIFMLTSADDLDWIRADVIKELAQGAFFPTFQTANTKSPALRTYANGDSLQTLAMLYNAESKAVSRSEIEIQSILYKDGAEFLRFEPKPAVPEKGGKAGNISILRRFALGVDIQPGDYVLQLLATDKKYSQKRDEEGGVFSESQGLFSRILRAYLNEDKNYDRKGVASQTLSFTVEEP